MSSWKIQFRIKVISRLPRKSRLIKLNDVSETVIVVVLRCNFKKINLIKVLFFPLKAQPNFIAVISKKNDVMQNDHKSGREKNIITIICRLHRRCWP